VKARPLTVCTAVNVVKVPVDKAMLVVDEVIGRSEVELAPGLAEVSGIRFPFEPTE